MKNLLITIAKQFFIFLLAIHVALVYPSAVSAQPVSWSGTPCVNQDGVATIKGLECLIGNVFIVFLSVLGLSGFVMIIIAAFRWMLSGGNTKGVETARNTMTFAVAGIVLALSGFIVLNLIAQFTGVEEILRFRIPDSTM